MHAKGSCLVGSGRDNAALSRASAHDDGFAAPLRVVELLNAGKERVEVHKANCRTVPATEEAGGEDCGIEAAVAIVCVFDIHEASIARFVEYACILSFPA